MGQRKRQILGILLSVLVLISISHPYSIKESQNLSVGEPLKFFAKMPPSILKTLSMYVVEGEKSLTLDGSFLERRTYNMLNPPVAAKPGKVSIQLKLFGVIPVKIINVDVRPEVKLIAGGHSIGVLLRTEGVMVVGFSPILDNNNKPVIPAKEAGILIGDVIVSINGEKIITDDQVEKIITSVKDEKGISIALRRRGQIYNKTIIPKFCNDTKSYRIGLFVRDNAGGIGTLTFYDPLTKKYGALGHVIADSDSNERLLIRQGKILFASIEDILKARKGIPGEKVGLFMENKEIGTIDKNDTCGIYGVATQDITNPHYENAMAIGYSGQIHPGKAQILTVVNGEEIRKYDINIEMVMHGRQDGKNMIIRVVDQELLEKTGGIIQGMSGSPIIQDDKIIGAVTHVFINDPVRGYGVFIENMLYEAGIFTKEKTLGLTSQSFFT